MSYDEGASDLWIGPATDADYGINLGESILVNVHAADVCAGRHCVLHDPSDHHMRSWPTLWRGDIRIMERTCPHGVGHPDPDDLTYQLSLGRDYVGVHGCDGCCARPE